MKSKVIIQNRAGLHARPISKFVEVASRFNATLTVSFHDQIVDGKSIIQLMTLAASHGAELELCSEGEDSEAMLSSLKKLVASGFEEY